MSDSWKTAERVWAKFFPGGKRIPSQGTENADIITSRYVAEHKFRTFSDYSAEFRKAIRQHDSNKRNHPDLIPLILFTFHEGRGVKNRMFLLVEQDNLHLSEEGVIQIGR